VKDMKLTPFNAPANRHQPIYTTLNFGSNDYKNFWSWADTWCAKWLEFLNDDVFGSGVPLPYQKLSFLTHLKFHPHALLAVVAVYYNN
jgi:hypothetical protein